MESIDRSIKILLVLVVVALLSVFVLNQMMSKPNVYTEPSDLEVVIRDVKTSNGSKTLNDIGKLIVKEDTQIKLEVIIPQVINRFEGIMLNLEVTLESEGRTYTINAPCVYASIPCNRVLVVLPGYDVPLPIEAGTYDVSVKVVWSVEGEGDIVFTLDFKEVEEEG